MTSTAVLNALICLLGAVTALTTPANIYIYLGLFFALSIVHEGVRQGRKTYLVDMAKGEKRTDYVSVSNTLIGFLLLVVGLFSGVIAQLSIVAVMLFFTVSSILAALLSVRLKNVSQ